MLSPKAKAAADKIKSFNEDDVQSISEMIKHEVQHATDVISERAKKAEARIRQFTDNPGEDISKVSKQAAQTINDHPVPSSLIALGVGLVLGVILTSGNRR